MHAKRKSKYAFWDFYMRNDISQPEDKFLDIIVSLDGAYQRRGHESTYCVSFLNECWTERPLDYEVSIKCFSCDNCEIWNSECPHGLFHGPSGNMEINNAIALFGRSIEAHGLRYRDYVADGDCKILPYLIKSDPYPNYLINKHECANHLAKRAFKSLKLWGPNWTVAKGLAFKAKQKKAAEKLQK